MISQHIPRRIRATPACRSSRAPPNTDARHRMHAIETWVMEGAPCRRRIYSLSEPDTSSPLHIGDASSSWRSLDGAARQGEEDFAISYPLGGLFPLPPPEGFPVWLGPLGGLGRGALCPPPPPPLPPEPGPIEILPIVALDPSPRSFITTSIEDEYAFLSGEHSTSLPECLPALHNESPRVLIRAARRISKGYESQHRRRYPTTFFLAVLVEECCGNADLLASLSDSPPWRTRSSPRGPR